MVAETANLPITVEDGILSKKATIYDKSTNMCTKVIG